MSDDVPDLDRTKEFLKEVVRDFYLAGGFTEELRQLTQKKEVLTQSERKKANRALRRRKSQGKR